VLKRLKHHLDMPRVTKSIKGLKAKFGFLENDLPALIVRNHGQAPTVLTYAGLNVHRLADFHDMAGLQVMMISKE
jgi:hypothetical protein